MNIFFDSWWIKAPAWAKFLTRDHDGSIWAFEQRPRLSRRGRWLMARFDGGRSRCACLGTSYLADPKTSESKDLSPAK